MYHASATASPAVLGLLQVDSEDGHLAAGIASVAVSNDDGFRAVRVALLGGHF